MTSGTAKAIFWGGTLSSALIFIANVVMTIAKAAKRSLIQYMLAGVVMTVWYLLTLRPSQEGG